MKLQTLNSSVLENLEPMLNESIYHFLVEFQKGRTDFSELGSICFRLIQTMTDPPLEFIWFYSALTFHTSKSSMLKESHSSLLIIKDLFHSLVSFWSPSDSYLKQIPLLAPVLHQLANLSSEIYSFKAEVEGLVDAIISHIIMCYCNDLDVQEVAFGKSTVSWVNLVPIWIADQVAQNHGCVDGFKLFFPLSTDDIRRGINADCGMTYLAGVVMIESFLLRLCLMFDSGASRKELHKDVKNYAAQIIKGFKKNSTFLVMLFKLLLEPSLPVTQLLTSRDELLLRGLLFDVVLDFDSFLSYDTFPQLSDVQYKELVFLLLFVTNSALQFASENGDHTGGDHILNAFSASALPRLITSWLTSKTSINPTAPDSSSPNDLIRWLLVLEQQGLNICDHSISELHEKAMKCKNGGEDGVGMVEDAPPVRVNGRRKRHSMGPGAGEVQAQIKVMKCCHGSSSNDGFCGGDEVGNSVPDQEMVDMVR